MVNITNSTEFEKDLDEFIAESVSVTDVRETEGLVPSPFQPPSSPPTSPPSPGLPPGFNSIPTTQSTLTSSARRRARALSGLSEEQVADVEQSVATFNTMARRLASAYLAIRRRCLCLQTRSWWLCLCRPSRASLRSWWAQPTLTYAKSLEAQVSD
uniref:Uncharacterized protein n=1 Tax=Chrysotila carterae TaxID=13221 RepID=A0A7S4F9I9_CHRCT